MSLVEQAIARMRKSGPRSVLEREEDPLEATPRMPPPTFAEPFPDPPIPSKQMVVDIGALRANGYLPEETRDRQFVDHYRRIKRPLIDKAASGIAALGLDPRMIMITSALPGDGKTFTSINLALSMALERDVSVLLMDCDVAKCHISQILGLGREPGLLDTLVDEALDVESLVIQTNIRGLSILPAGNRTESSTELLSSNRMRQLVANLCKRDPRRILLLDSPPLLITNEGRSLVKIAGQVVLVARSGHTPSQALQEAVGLFDPKQAGGIILNQVPVSPTESYYGYGAYGAYGSNGPHADES
jgi:exopolysaccharide/PEP-CTERM locus tyrosine autokinase